MRKDRRFLRLVVLLTLALAPGVVTAQGADSKIDPDLMEALTSSADATASFFVQFREKANVKPAHGIQDSSARRAFVVDQLKRVAARSQSGVTQVLRRQGVAFTSFWVNNSIYVPDGNLDLARELARHPLVGRVFLEEIVETPEPQPAGDASTAAVEWGVVMINADDVWAQGHRGAGLVVANIDTGVEYTHSALVEQYRGNTGSGFDHNGNWSDPTGVCGGSAPCDNHRHGTHTMGTMLGDDGVSNQIGVAPDAEWIACKGCATNSCSGSALNACAQFVLDPLGNGDSSVVPDVVNNSWGGGSGDSWYRNNVLNWRAAGIFPAFSNGNSGPGCGTAGTPGDYIESFAAGAISSSGSIASFSSRGPSAFSSVVKPNVSAPGVSVRSSMLNNSYGSMSGTSMASPHVAGAVALLWDARPALRGDIGCTEQILQQTADKVITDLQCGGDSVADNVYGHGQLNVLNAVTLGACNASPTVTITAPGHNSEHDCGTGVGFTATGSDPLEGSLNGSVEWSDDGSSNGFVPSTGGNVSKTFSCDTGLGWHTIEAYVQDAEGASDADVIDVLIVNPNALVAPANLQASATGLDVTLSWDDSNTAEDGYWVERMKVCKGKEKRTNSLCEWGSLGQTAANAAGYSETVPESGSFDYRAYAFAGAETGPADVVRIEAGSGEGGGGGGGKPEKPCRGSKCQP